MIKDSILYFFAKFFPSIISMLTMLLFLKEMDSENYGEYSIIIVTLGLINILSSQWLRSSMIRYYYESPKILDTIITMQLIVIFILLILNTIIMSIFDFNAKILICCNIILVNLIIFEFLNNYFRTIIKPTIVLFGNLIRNIFFIGALLLFVWTNIDLNLLDGLISFFIGLFVSNCYQLYFFRMKINITIDKSFLNKIKLYGIPLTISFALGVFLQNIDKYMITYIVNFKSNGNYSLIYDFIHNSLYMIIGSLGMASLPRIVKNSLKDFNTKDFNKYIEVVYLISLPLTITFIIISSDLTKIINTTHYNTSEFIIIFIILGTLIHGTNSFIYGQAIQLMENTRVIYIPSIIAIIVNVILNLFLLPNIGVLGAAISTLLAFFISNITMYYLFLRNTYVIYFPKIIFVCLPIGMLSVICIHFVHIENIFISIIVKGTLSLILQVSLLLLYFQKFKKSFN